MTRRDQVLAALRALRESQNSLAEQEANLVVKARRLGLSWQEIADALEVTKAGVWKRYRDLTD